MVFDVNDDSCVEVILEDDFGNDGFRFWMTGSDFKNEVLAEAKSENGAFVLPDQLPEASTSRDVISVGRFICRVACFDFKSPQDVGLEAGESLAGPIAKTIDALIVPDGDRGIWQYSFNDTALRTKCDEQVLAAEANVPEKPRLLLIHGTLSKSDWAFAGLLTGDAPEQKEARNTLRDRYHEVLAFDHPTLGESPINNALQLAKSLPNGARLHVVTHSRGGLVGDLLSFDGRASEELRNRIFEGTYENLRQPFEELCNVLKGKKFKIERFVRVASPSSGTTLASYKLDYWLAALDWSLRFVPGVAGQSVSAIVSFARGVVGAKGDPKKLPGIEAMMPESRTILLLQFLKADGDLSVIAGKALHDAGWRWMADVVTNSFFGRDNDWVVDTKSMECGVPRKNAVVFLQSGARISHCEYFVVKDTLKAIVDRLKTAPNADTRSFTKIKSQVDLRRDLTDHLAPRLETKKTRGSTARLPLCFVLPGIMGSRLNDNTQEVWLSKWQVFIGGLSRLDINSNQVRSVGLLDEYSDLIERISDTHRVIPFAYDWRQSIAIAAKNLASYIEQTVTDEQLPVRCLAHSMGGLVLKQLYSAHPQAWAKLKRHPESRIVLLGTPLRGSASIVQFLLGQDEVIRTLATADVRHDKLELLKIISRFPGVLELLPHDPARKFYDPSFWSQRFSTDQNPDWEVPQSTDLKAAQQFASQLKSSFDEHVLYVAGQAPATPVRLKSEPAPDRGLFGGGGSSDFDLTTEGDGRVLWQDSDHISRRWFMPAQHGELAKKAKWFEALIELLQEGNTKKLPTQKPVTRELSAMAHKKAPILLSDDRDFALTMMGGGSSLEADPPRSRVKVLVTHGDIAYARHVLLVGHYQGVPIVDVEARLDHVLQRRLSQAFHMGIYPGEAGSAEVFRAQDPDWRPKGAVVMGLGNTGDLSVGTLENSYLNAILKFAHSESAANNGDPTRLKLSTLLIGTGTTNLTVSDSVAAVLRAVLAANDRLAKYAGPNSSSLVGKSTGEPPQICELEIVELWEDLANAAAKSLLKLQRQAPFEHRIETEAGGLKSRGGQTRMRVAEGQGWWSRLWITMEQGRMKFEILTRRARSAAFEMPDQRKLIESFLKQVTGTTQVNADAAVTLFEMLVPLSVKLQVAQRDNLVLVLDDETAMYPWELMQDRENPNHEPLAVAAGMVRHLKVKSPSPPTTDGHECTALVIGDIDTAFTKLDAAVSEGQAVSASLQFAKYAVRSLQRPKLLTVLTEFHRRPYRIIHIAAHGVHEYGPEKTSGLVIGSETISGKLQPIVLGPEQIAQVRPVPDFVFLNCCHLGKTSDDEILWQDRHRLAGNIGAQFIHMGVRAIIVAGWAVEDAAGRVFAESFYEQFLQGMAFGEAVKTARRRTYLDFPASNTWGAYQCYGDPGYVLPLIGDPAELPGSSGFGSSDPQHPTAPENEIAAFDSLVSIKEICIEIENIMSAAGSSCSGNQTASSQKLRRLESYLRQHHPAWLESAEVASALGIAYSEIAEFDDSIKYINKAIECSSGVVPFLAHERLIDSWNRQAQIKLEESLTTEASQILEQSFEHCRKLQQIASASSEVRILEGAIHKRKALIANPDEMADKLREWRGLTEDARTKHRNAPKLKNSESDKDAGDLPLCAFVTESSRHTLMYYQMSVYMADVLLCWCDNEPEKHQTAKFNEIEHWCQSIDEEVRALDADAPAFWNGAFQGAIPLLLMLVGKEYHGTPVTADMIADGYNIALRRGVSPRDRNSILQHLRFLARIIDTIRQSKSVPAKKRSKGFVTALKQRAAICREVAAKIE